MPAEIDPLECPKCKAQMRIIAFFQNEHSIKEIPTFSLRDRAEELAKGQHPKG
jgi:hypothetical protein